MRSLPTPGIDFAFADTVVANELGEETLPPSSTSIVVRTEAEALSQESHVRVIEAPRFVNTRRRLLYVAAAMLAMLLAMMGFLALRSEEAPGTPGTPGTPGKSAEVRARRTLDQHTTRKTAHQAKH